MPLASRRSWSTLTSPIRHLEPVRQRYQVRRAWRRNGCSSRSAAPARSGLPGPRRPPADSDRDIGFNRHVEEVPEDQGRRSGWQRRSPVGIWPTVTKITNDFISGGWLRPRSCIRASGMGAQIVRRDQGGQQAVRADCGRAETLAHSSSSFIDPSGYPNPVGAAVTKHGSQSAARASTWPTSRRPGSVIHRRPPRPP